MGGGSANEQLKAPRGFTSMERLRCLVSPAALATAAHMNMETAAGGLELELHANPSIKKPFKNKRAMRSPLKMQLAP